MSDYVKVALILGLVVVSIVGLRLYFSPFQQCVRSLDDNVQAEIHCAKAIGGYKSQ